MRRRKREQNNMIQQEDQQKDSITSTASKKKKNTTSAAGNNFDDDDNDDDKDEPPPAGKKSDIFGGDGTHQPLGEENKNQPQEMTTAAMPKINDNHNAADGTTGGGEKVIPASIPGGEAVRHDDGINVTSTDGIKEEEGKNSAPKPHAILHIGPRKTGTTSIQVTSMKFVKELKQDQYEMPLLPGERRGNRVQFASCFYDDSIVMIPKRSCDARLLEVGRNIAMKNSSLLISSEAFDRPAVQMNLVKEYLNPWNVTVVYVYRRYYSWLKSLHQQLTKNFKDDLNLFTRKGTEYLRQNLTEFIKEAVFFNECQYNHMYLAVERFKKEFNQVIILNMHDKTNDFIQQFFCNVMPHSASTCTAVKARKSYTTKANPSIMLTYHDLAYHAHYLGMIHISTQHQLKRAVRLIEKHQKVTLNLSDTDFEITCPDRALLDALLERSLKMEKLMMPEFFQGPWGESKLRSDFEHQAKSSLCDVDLSGTVKSREWVGFFASLNESLSSMV